MYERCPFCASPGREIRSAAGEITAEDAKSVVDGAPLPYGLWWRCTACGADYGYITWGVQQLIVGNKWAPRGRQGAYRTFDFWTTDTNPERRMIGTFNCKREIIRLLDMAK